VRRYKPSDASPNVAQLKPGRYIISSFDKKSPLTMTIEKGSVAIQARDHIVMHKYGAGLSIRLQPDGTPVITGRTSPPRR
jgi:hypothetical protein